MMHGELSLRKTLIRGRIKMSVVLQAQDAKSGTESRCSGRGAQYKQETSHIGHTTHGGPGNT